MYFRETDGWLRLYWDDRKLSGLLARVSREQGRLLGGMEGLGFELRSEAHLEMLTAGLAHLWFITIHPFEDGNGRIARAIADMALARSEGTGQRYYSLSAQIRRERSAYYAVLERTQKGPLDVTAWQDWFLGCLGRAIEGAEGMLGTVLDKARFWQRFATESFNERQLKVLNRMLDGFEGKLSTSKWARMARCSQDTAYRDILDLVERGVLKKEPGGGRSTRYSLVGFGEDRRS